MRGLPIAAHPKALRKGATPMSKYKIIPKMILEGSSKMGRRAFLLSGVSAVSLTFAKGPLVIPHGTDGWLLSKGDS